MRNGEPWTAKELIASQRMRVEGRTYAQVAEFLGRTRSAVKARFAKLDRPSRAARTIPMFVPESALEERDRRLALAPRDTTALLLGDPLPGFSALERAR